MDFALCCDLLHKTRDDQYGFFDLKIEDGQGEPNPGLEGNFSAYICDENTSS